MSSVEEVASRVADGSPLTEDDEVVLAATTDIVTLGMMADDERKRRHGTRTTFLRVAEIEQPRAGAAPPAIPQAAREVRLTGAFTTLERARDAVRVAASPASAPVSGFSLADLESAAAGDLHLLRTWLRTLRDDGLSLLAEAPIDRLRDPEAALRACVDAGLAPVRLTVEAHGEGGVLGTIRRMRPLVAAGLVHAVAPVPRRPDAEPSTGYEDVKAVALARLLLDVPHVQVDWTRHGPKMAQVALTFGADDVDSVSARDEVGEGRRRAPLEEILRNIRAAALDPAERDARFGAVGA